MFFVNFGSHVKSWVFREVYVFRKVSGFSWGFWVFVKFRFFVRGHVSHKLRESCKVLVFP